jgi:hypothetical protein
MSATDEDIRLLVTRLARPYPSGGDVIEHAAILAAGPDAAAILAWIADHDGHPEPVAPATAGPGLHGARVRPGGSTLSAPRRYVLPAGTLAP